MTCQVLPTLSAFIQKYISATVLAKKVHMAVNTLWRSHKIQMVVQSSRYVLCTRACIMSSMDSFTENSQLVCSDLPTLTHSEWDSSNCFIHNQASERERVRTLPQFQPALYMLSLQKDFWKLPHFEISLNCPILDWQVWVCFTRTRKHSGVFLPPCYHEARTDQGIPWKCDHISNPTSHLNQEPTIIVHRSTWITTQCN